MASPVIQIEAIIPTFDSLTQLPQWQAVQTFIANMRSLGITKTDTGFILFTDGTSQYATTVITSITTNQQVTVNGWLNTLNAALGQSIICYSTNSQLIP